MDKELVNHLFDGLRGVLQDEAFTALIPSETKLAVLEAFDLQAEEVTPGHLRITLLFLVMDVVAGDNSSLSISMDMAKYMEFDRKRKEDNG